MSSDLSATSRFAVSGRFEQACAIARRAIPQGQKQGHEFAQACLRGTKTKAELLSKTLSSSCSHHKLLDLSAGLRGFRSWHELNQFARTFEKTEDAERSRWPQSFLMTTALWTLTPSDEENPLVRDTLNRTLSALQSLLPEKIDRPAAELILRRIMFQRDPKHEYWGENKEVMQDVINGLEYFLGMTPETILLALLARVPVVNGQRADWMPLSTFTVGQLLDLPLANESSDAGFGYDGWAHAVADLHAELTSIYAKYGPGIECAPFIGEGDGRLEKRSAQLRRSLNSPLARIICRDFLKKKLEPYLSLTVDCALTADEGETGFYRSFYSGPPEKVETDWALNYSVDTHEIKRVVFREPFGEFQLSIFRLRRWFETNGPRLYEFEAVVHDNDDVLIAKLGLALFIGEGQTSPYDLAWALDEHNEDDLREIGLGLAHAAYDGEFDEDSLDRVMVLREWEVRKDHRRKGLGKKLLNEAIRRSIRGLATPSILACRLCPLRLAIHPYKEWVADVADGTARGPQLELAGPVIQMQEIFRRCVDADTFVWEKGMEVFDAPYVPWVHRSPELAVLAVSIVASPPR